MSEEKKSEKKERMTLKRFLDLWLNPGLIIGAIVFVWVVAETRIFSSPDIKVETEKLVQESPNAEDRWRQHYRDSINTVHAIKSRAMRDSLFVLFKKDIEETKKAVRHQDSINMLNADQVFQIKEELKKLNRSN